MHKKLWEETLEKRRSGAGQHVNHREGSVFGRKISYCARECAVINTANTKKHKNTKTRKKPLKNPKNNTKNYKSLYWSRARHCR